MFRRDSACERHNEAVSHQSTHPPLEAARAPGRATSTRTVVIVSMALVASIVLDCAVAVTWLTRGPRSVQYTANITKQIGGNPDNCPVPYLVLKPAIVHITAWQLAVSYEVHSTADVQAVTTECLSGLPKYDSSSWSFLQNKSTNKWSYARGFEYLPPLPPTYDEIGFMKEEVIRNHQVHQRAVRIVRAVSSKALVRVDVLLISFTL